MIRSKICDLEIVTVGILYNFQNIPKLIPFNPLPLYYMGKLRNSTQNMLKLFTPDTCPVPVTYVLNFCLCQSHYCGSIQILLHRHRSHLGWVAAESGL